MLPIRRECMLGMPPDYDPEPGRKLRLPGVKEKE